MSCTPGACCTTRRGRTRASGSTTRTTGRSSGAESCRARPTRTPSTTVPGSKVDRAVWRPPSVRQSLIRFGGHLSLKGVCDGRDLKCAWFFAGAECCRFIPPFRPLRGHLPPQGGKGGDCEVELSSRRPFCVFKFAVECRPLSRRLTVSYASFSCVDLFVRHRPKAVEASTCQWVRSTCRCEDRPVNVQIHL